MRKRIQQLSTGQIGTWVARHEDYAVPMNEVKFGTTTALLKDDEIKIVGYEKVSGIDIQLGDYRPLDNDYVAKVELGQVEAGARYADVTTDTGIIDRCWEGFFYSIVR